MADSFKQFELMLNEYINPAIRNLTFDDDDVAWNVIGMFAPEPIGGRREYDTSASEYPAGWEALYRIQVQKGGRVAGGTYKGNTPVTVGKDDHLYVGQGKDAKYLDPTKTPMASSISIKMILQRIKGSITRNFQQFDADVASRPLSDIAVDATTEAVSKARSYIMNAFYGDGLGTLALVNDSTPPDPVETAGGVEVAIDGGTFARFQLGDLIVFASPADPRVLRTGNGVNGYTGHCRIVAIDDDSRVIRVESEPGVGTIAAVADNDVIMLADTYDFTQASAAAGSLVPQGVKSLLITSGTFPGSTSPKFSSGLDVSHHTALKSFVSTNSTNVEPSMEKLSAVLDKIHDGGHMPPPLMIAERSVWSRWAIWEKQNQTMVQVPQGQATIQTAGGVAGPVLGFMEDRFQKFNSARVDPNMILGLDPETWMRFMPLGDRTIRWRAGNGPLAGIQSIFLPVWDGTQLTELVDAPFDLHVEFGCWNPKRNFRYIGVKAQRDV